MREPRRLIATRYVLLNPLYVRMIAAQATGAVDYDSTPAPPAEARSQFGMTLR